MEDTESGQLAVWGLPDGVTFAPDEIAGYVVEAADCVVGRVLQAHVERDRGFLILTASPWVGTAWVMLPPALITRIDRAKAVIHFASDRAEIRTAPPFAADRFRDLAYRTELAFHYARGRRHPDQPTRPVAQPTAST